MAALEIGNLPGLIAPVRSNQAALSTLVETQTWPPVGASGPSPSVPTYITFENPEVSLIPPAASERTRFTSLPPQMPSPPVSKLLLTTENPAPLAAPRHTRHVPTINVPESCGPKMQRVYDAPDTPATVAVQTTSHSL